MMDYILKLQIILDCTSVTIFSDNISYHIKKDIQTHLKHCILLMILKCEGSQFLIQAVLHLWKL